ncbi:hypothetical protein [Streptomyces sp. t39]|uniref:hypothetical protein n=1 Tax=Streptomyces sp. t39 TaxID=1828156 RepID=UPI0011CE78E3|nr:hypothetical protein [Streptomyces sp. t39]TXS35088.1 hypothetical protein EAO77_37975 [Streptomyces sp. t39]
MPTDEFAFVPFLPSPAGAGPNREFRPHHKYGPAARRLRQRPGAWAVIRTAPSSAVARNRASAIRRGEIPAFLPAGDFEATHRQVNGEWRVYARFVGGGFK